MRWMVLAVIAVCACGTARPRPRQAEVRVPDAIPERVAGVRNAEPEIHAEDEEGRWGMEEHRQRELEKRRRAAAQKAAGAKEPKGADVSKQANQPSK